MWSALGFELGVTPYDEAPARLRFEPVFGQLPAAVCGSGDSVAHWTIGMECAMLLDNQGYALAKVCWRERAASTACAKVCMSDGADHAAADDWRRNLHKAADDFLGLYRGVVKP